MEQCTAGDEKKTIHRKTRSSIKGIYIDQLHLILEKLVYHMFLLGRGLFIFLVYIQYT